IQRWEVESDDLLGPTWGVADQAGDREHCVELFGPAGGRMLDDMRSEHSETAAEVRRESVGVAAVRVKALEPGGGERARAGQLPARRLYHEVTSGPVVPPKRSPAWKPNRDGAAA